VRRKHEQASGGTKSARRESEWRDRLARYAASGRTVAAFCRSESVSTPTFYQWRTRLAKPAVATNRVDGALPGGFIDVSAVGGGGTSLFVREPELGLGYAQRLEIKFDLGGGVVVHVVRS
jgi:putative transposase